MSNLGTFDWDDQLISRSWPCLWSQPGLGVRWLRMPLQTRERIGSPIRQRSVARRHLPDPCRPGTRDRGPAEPHPTGAGRRHTATGAV